MILDIICLVCAAYGFYVGYSRGIIKTVLTAASFLFGVTATAKFSPTVGDMLLGSFPTMGEGFSLLLGMILTFILTLAIFRLVANGLENVLEAVNINFINQIMGGVISMLFLILLYSSFVAFADNSRLIDETTKTTSKTYAIVRPLPDYAWKTGKRIWPVFQEFYHHAMDIMDQIDSQVERQENDRFFEVEDEENNGRPRRY
ncbi:MAG: CvpA family protein [Bacteroidota bacterium]